MSSRYDKVKIGENVTLPDFEGDEHEVTFQSKSLSEAFMMREVIVKKDGLYVENFHIEEVPLEERKMIKEKDYDNPEEEASALEKSCGMITKETVGFEKRNYHGMFEFYNTFDGESYRYVAKYTDGILEDIKREE